MSTSASNVEVKTLRRNPENSKSSMFNKTQRGPLGTSRHGNVQFAGLPDGSRNHIIAVFGELLGTYMFFLFGYVIAQIANSDKHLDKEGSNPAQLIMIAFGFGFSVMVSCYVFFRVWWSTEPCGDFDTCFGQSHFTTASNSLNGHSSSCRNCSSCFCRCFDSGPDFVCGQSWWKCFSN